MPKLYRAFFTVEELAVLSDGDDQEEKEDDGGKDDDNNGGNDSNANNGKSLPNSTTELSWVHRQSLELSNVGIRTIETYFDSYLKIRWFKSFHLLPILARRDRQYGCCDCDL